MSIKYCQQTTKESYSSLSVIDIYMSLQGILAYIRFQLIKMVWQKSFVYGLAKQNISKIRDWRQIEEERKNFLRVYKQRQFHCDSTKLTSPFRIKRRQKKEVTMK